jgi:CubicO group peptidase (beta-lactamase class C family)
MSPKHTLLAALLSAMMLAPSACAQSATNDLTGLWFAKLRFGPDVRGRLVLDRANGAWRASITGRSATVELRPGGTMMFELPGNVGGFRASLQRARGGSDSLLVGHWWHSNRFVAPLTLTSCGDSCFEGEVVPSDEALTFYLKVMRLADGSYSAFLRNPERNFGGGPWIPVRAIRRDGQTVALLDRTGSTLATGTFRDGVMSILLRGETYDFTRLPDSASTDYYPRGRPTVKYTYTPPQKGHEGWDVARMREVGIAEDSITVLVQRLIDLPIDSVSTPQTHALLIARHGKLVLEEYFNGEHMDKVHDTRSASKTYVTALVGAAMNAGVPITPETSVYGTLRPGSANLPVRKRDMTLEHLLTMSAGFDCDDSGNRPGDEDAITNQDANPDWASIILGVDMVRDNDSMAVYCSMKPYLAGLMLEKVSGRILPDLFQDLLAKPLDFQRYYLGVTPLGQVYFGGGTRVVARDFLKLPQVYLNGGTWHGRRIMTKEWVERSIQPRYKIGSRRYGYLWWIKDYTYRGRTIQAYMQLGNGSQNAIFIPELDLAIAAFGANYNSPTINWLLNELLPRHILPAIQP